MLNSGKMKMAYLESASTVTRKSGGLVKDGSALTEGYFQSRDLRKRGVFPVGNTGRPKGVPQSCQKSMDLDKAPWLPTEHSFWRKEATSLSLLDH